MNPRLLVAAVGLAMAWFVATPANAQTDAFWNSATTGNWVDASKWSTNPVYPNGPLHRAMFLATGPAYTVTLNSNVDVYGVVLNSSTLTLDHTAGTLSLNGGTIDLTSGTLRLNGGTLSGGTLDANGGSFVATSAATNRLVGMTIDGSLNLANNGQRFSVADGLTFTSGSGLTFAPSAGSTVAFQNTQTLTGGTLNFLANGNNFLNVDAGAALTLSPTTTIRGGGLEFGNKSVSGAGNSIINQGLISADRSGRLIKVTADSVTNSGTIEARNGGDLWITGLNGNVNSLGIYDAGSSVSLNGNYTLNQNVTVPSGAELFLEGSYSNTATLTADAGSTVYLGGTFTESQLGTFNRTGASVKLYGTLDLQGGSMTLGQPAPITTYGGTVRNGTVDFATNQFVFGEDAIRFQDVTLQGDLVVDGASTVYLRGSNALNGSITLSADRAGLVFDSDQFLPAGTINLDAIDPSNSNVFSRFGIFNGADVVLGPGVVVRGGSAQFSGGATATLTNQGLISADVAGSTALVLQPDVFTNSGTIQAISGGRLHVHNASGGLGTAFSTGAGSVLSVLGNGSVNNGTLTLSSGGAASFAGTWSNTGVINVGSGSTLTLGGTMTPGSIGVINNNGLVALSGTVNNAANTLSMNGQWQLTGATVNGGTLQTQPGGFLNASGTSTLNGVTFAGTGSITNANARVVLTGAVTTLTPGSQITVAAPGAGFEAPESTTLNGGAIVFSGTSGANRRLSSTFGTLTLGPSLTVSGGRATIGGTFTDIGAGGSIANQGLISADVPGQALTVINAFTNTGTIRAINGGTLTTRYYAGSGAAYADGPGSVLTLGDPNGTSFITAPVSATNGATLNIGGNDWSNTSTITATNATIGITGRVTTAAMGTIVGTNSNIRLASILNNNSSTLNLTAAMPWTVDGGLITGGSLNAPAGSLNFSNNPNNQIQNVSSSSRVFINGGRLIGTTFRPNAGLTLTNSANVELTTPGDTMGHVEVTDSALTLLGAGAAAGTFTSLALTNGSLILGGTGRSTILLPRVTRSGATSASMTGQWTNIGRTTNFDATSGQWTLAGARIDGGTINITGNNLVVSPSAQLVNVTIGTPFNLTGGQVTGQINFSSGINLTNGSSLTFSTSQPLWHPINVDASVLGWNGTIYNNNVVTLTNGSTFNIGDVTLTNTGSINLIDSTLNLTGNYFSNQFGTINRTNSVVNFSGSLTQTTSSLALTAASGNWNLSNGQIYGGSITTSGGAQLVATSGNFNRLDGVAVQGDVRVGPNAILNLAGAWSNTGSFTVENNGTLALGGTFSANNTGLINRLAGGRIRLTGVADNTASTLTLDASSGSWEMGGGTLHGGTVNLTAGSILDFNHSGSDRSGVLSALTLNGDISLPNGATLTTKNGVTLNSNVTVSPTSQVYARGTHTITGGTISLLGSANNSTARFFIDNDTGPAPTVTLSPSTTLRGGFAEVRAGSSTVATLINQGTISADVAAQPMSVSPANLTNSGTLRAINGGTLETFNSTNLTNSGHIHVGSGSTMNLGGNITFLPTSTFDTSAGTFNLVGMANITGSTLTLDSSTGTWNLRGNGFGGFGGLRGGTLNINSGGGLAIASGQRGDFDNLTLNGAMTSNGTLNIFNGLTLNGSIDLTGASDSSANFYGTGSVTGSGTISIVPTGTARSGLRNTNNSSLTLGSSLTVRGGGALSDPPKAMVGDNNFAGSTTLTNYGLVSADLAGKELVVGASTFTNHGTLEAKNGSQLRIRNDTNVTWSNPTGQFRLLDNSTMALGGRFNSSSVPSSRYDGAGGRTFLEGAMENSSATWTLTPTMGEWTLRNQATIKGGTVVVQSGASLKSTFGVLDGVTLQGDVTVPSGSLIIRNGIDLQGTIRLTGPTSVLAITASPDFTLTSGTIAFDNLAGAASQLNAVGFANGPTRLTIGPAATIRGGTGLIFTNTSSTIENQGLISSNRPGETISINLTRFVNNGTLEAINGGFLTFIPPNGLASPDTQLLNSGLLRIAADSGMGLVGGFAQNSTGTLLMALNETSLGARLTGLTASLEGTLAVELAPGFSPAYGQHFTLFQFSEIDGAFSSVSLPSLAGGLSWDTSSLYESGQIGVVPAPAGVLVVTAGLFSAFRRRRLSSKGAF